MTLLILALIDVALFLTLAFIRAPLWAWTASYLTLAVGTTALVSSPWVSALTWIAMAVIFIPLNILPLRRFLISNRLLGWFKSVLPPMSQTEREAIDAGTVWWDAELFTGNPNFSKLSALEAPKLSPEEQAFLDGPVETLCQMLDSYQIEQDKDLPPAVWEHLKAHRFFSLIIPKQYGGHAFSAVGNSAILVKIASRNVTCAVTVMVPNSLGPGELLTLFGTPEQKQHYLPRLASHEDIPCFALTGPLNGSDAGAMPDVGVVTKGEYEGEEVLGFRISINKRYITLAPVATLVGLAFIARDPNGLLGDVEDIGVTCALLPSDLPGLQTGERHMPIGAQFQNGTVKGDNLFVPLKFVIGGEAYVGQGWMMLMKALSAGRGISLPAEGVAEAKKALAMSGAYARIRKQFKVPIGKFEGIEEVLARMAGETYRMDAARLLTLQALDAGEKPSVISAIVKYHLTEGFRRVVTDGMDVHAGKAVITGPKNYMAAHYANAPIAITVEGANILTRNMIIFGQGAIRCHPYLLKEMLAASGDDLETAQKQFDKALFGHIGYTISNTVRTLLTGLTGGKLLRTPVKGPAAGYYKQITRMSSAFALTADLALLILGGRFKFAERLSARFGDVLSHLYMLSATLEHYRRSPGVDGEELALHWAANDSLKQIAVALDGIWSNFPIAVVGDILRAVTFPLGVPYHGVSDRTEGRLAQATQRTGSLRDRLIAGIFDSKDPEDITGVVEDALIKVLAAEPIERTIGNALNLSVTGINYESVVERALAAGVITEDQAETVRAAHLASAEVIEVDAFAPAQVVQRPTIVRETDAA